MRHSNPDPNLHLLTYESTYADGNQLAAYLRVAFLDQGQTGRQSQTQLRSLATPGVKKIKVAHTRLPSVGFRS